MKSFGKQARVNKENELKWENLDRYETQLGVILALKPSNRTIQQKCMVPFLERKIERIGGHLGI